MIVYYMLMCVIFTLSYIYTKDKRKKYRDLIFFIIFMIVFLFSALRYNVGADYSKGYVSTYNLIKYGYNVHFEVLFLKLNELVILIFDNVNWVFAISSFITFFILMNTLKTESSNFFISMIVLFSSRFYLYSFGQVRQYIAIAIFLGSLKYIIEGRWKRYFFMILIACGFHKTSIIYFAIYFLRYIKLDKKKYIILCLCAPALTPIVNYLYKILGMNLYSSYIVNKIGAGETPIVFIATGFIFSIIPLIMYNKISQNKKYQLYLNIQLITWFIIVTASKINESYRIIGMFIYISMLLLPECYNKADKNTKLIILAILIGMAFYTSYLMFIYPNSCLIPYQTIWNK